MADRRIAYIRQFETHEGEHLIRADRKKIKIATELLNGVVPGFRVNYGGGLERFIPATNVMSVELEHTGTDDALEKTAAMLVMVEKLQETRANIKKVTVKDLKSTISKAQKAAASAADLVVGLPKDGQIAKDRKALKDTTDRVIRLGTELEGLIPAAEDKPKA